MRHVLVAVLVLSGLLTLSAPDARAASFTITTIAGDGSSGFTGDGGPASSARFDGPGMMVADTAGNLYVSDTSNHRVRKIDTDGDISTIAGTGTASSTGDGGLATAATFNNPWGLNLDEAGNLYVTEYSGHRVRKINTAGYVSTIVGDGTPSSIGDGGPATGARVNTPNSVEFDTEGNIYIAEYYGHRVRKIDASTGNISTIAGTGTATSTGDGGAATSATINTPSQAVVYKGEVYIAEYSGHRIRKVDAAGDISTVVGTGSAGSSGDSGAATSALINTPETVKFDSAGNMYITDSYSFDVRRVDGSGVITTVVGTGTSGYSGDGGAATDAEVTYICGISISPNGDVYFSDWGTHTIRKVALLAPASAGVRITATIPPNLTFNVIGRASTCNGQSATNFQTGSTGTAITLGSLTAATSGGGAQDLSVTTNAGGGFSVYIKTTGSTPDPFNDGNGNTVPDVSGTHASPGTAPTGVSPGFGYTSSDASTPFTSNTWAALTDSNESVLIGAPGTMSKSACVGYQVGIDASIAAGSYSADVVYTAIPTF